MDNERRLEQKLDKISDKIASIDVTLAAQHITLEEHIRRTAILENKMGPVERQVDFIQSLAKLITVMGVVATIVSTLLKLTKVI